MIFASKIQFFFDQNLDFVLGTEWQCTESDTCKTCDKSNGQCDSCAKDKFLDNSTGHIECTDCPEGTFSYRPGAPVCDTCDDMLPGCGECFTTCSKILKAEADERKRLACAKEEFRNRTAEKLMNHTEEAHAICSERLEAKKLEAKKRMRVAEKPAPKRKRPAKSQHEDDDEQAEQEQVHTLLRLSDDAEESELHKCEEIERKKIEAEVNTICVERLEAEAANKRAAEEHMNHTQHEPGVLTHAHENHTHTHGELEHSFLRLSDATKPQLHPKIPGWKQHLS